MTDYMCKSRLEYLTAKDTGASLLKREATAIPLTLRVQSEVKKSASGSLARLQIPPVLSSQLSSACEPSPDRSARRNTSLQNTDRIRKYT